MWVKGIKNDLLFKEDGFLTPDFSDNKDVYKIIDTNDIEFYIQYAKEDKIVSTLDKLGDLKRLDEESNPIIFYYEYKDTE